MGWLLQGHFSLGSAGVCQVDCVTSAGQVVPD